MTTPEKFCLRWNDFKDNVSTSFASLREDKDLSDVTLACEDGQQMVAHKVILASSSPFFQNLFRRNKHEHTLIYMRGMKYVDLVAIVDFLYYGEANIYQENLDNFLNIAEELNLKGLNRDGSSETAEYPDLKVENGQSKAYAPLKTQDHAKNQQTLNNIQTNLDLNISENHGINETAVVLPKHDFSGDLEELEVKVKSMMSLSNNILPHGTRRPYICQVCGKEGQNGSIKDHIEANHIEGIVVPCHECEKTFRSRASLRHHKLHQHQ